MSGYPLKSDFAGVLFWAAVAAASTSPFWLPFVAGAAGVLLGWSFGYRQ